MTLQQAKDKYLAALAVLEDHDRLSDVARGAAKAWVRTCRDGLREVENV